MTNGNYIKAFKVLGKCAYGYDLSVAEYDDQNEILATIQDQVATGDPDDNVITLLFGNRYAQLASARNAVPILTYQQMASDFLTSTYFTDMFVHDTPASATAAAVLASLQIEMSTADGDDKTLTTLASTGLVNFFNSLLSAPGTWNTEADGTADYKDSVYVVVAVV